MSRTFGDTECKLEHTNGNPNVVIAKPEIKSFLIDKGHDFVVLGCDGIFDKMTDRDVVDSVWKSVEDEDPPTIHKQLGVGVEYVMKNTLFRKSLDNVTVVIVGFEGFKKKVFG